MEVMNSGWTEKELCNLYRDAKNKKEQIKIIAELLGMTSTKFAIEILERGGVLNDMTDLVKERIVQFHKQGLSDKAISKELLLAQSQVSTYLRKQGLPPNGKKFPKKNEIQEDKEVDERKEAVKSVEIKPEELKQMVEEVKAELPEVKQTDVIENLKKEKQKNFEELKEVLPKSIPDQDDLPIAYDVIETLTPQQYYELAKMTIQSINSMIETFRTVWEA